VAGREERAVTVRDTDIRVGDHVRSYDFPGDTEWYVEGTVEGFAEIQGCTRYALRVERVVQEGRALPDVKPFVVYPPVNGTVGSISRRILNTVVKIITDFRN
jgi:hypothetical protein